MTTTASYDAHHLEQILSLLNDQHECLTLRSIMLELTVTRCIARDILEEVVTRVASASNMRSSMKNDTKYEVVRMIPKRRGEVGAERTAMELVVTDPNDSGDDNNSKGSIFSVAVVPNDTRAHDMDEDDVDENGNVLSIHQQTKSCNAAGTIQIVSGAHEKALAVQRDMLTTGCNGGVAQLCSIFGADGINIKDGSGTPRFILPAPELCIENEDGMRVIRREKRGRDVVVIGASYHTGSGAAANGKKSYSSAAAASARISTIVTKKGKATTAAEFFKNTNSSGSTASKKKTKADPKMGEEEEKKEEEKENSRNKKAVNNVDDFVGDVDEDEGFLEEEKARKARVAKEAMNDEKAKKRNTDGIDARRSKIAPDKRQKRLEREEMDVDYDDSDVEEEKKTGAMDAFTRKEEKSVSAASTGGVKKLRKKLVEETTIDANGYMRTETVTVWEEVSDEEVEVMTKPAVAKAVTLKSKGTSDVKSGKSGGGPKKQAGLASFFAKKK